MAEANLAKALKRISLQGLCHLAAYLVAASKYFRNDV